MSGSSTAPRVSKPQPSRKGKKSWRKNVDIQDIEESLEEKRDREILIGSADKDAVDGFVIDSAPSASTLAKKWAKKSKTSEILSNKSKVEALTGPKKPIEKKTIQGVKKTDMLRLIKLNGGKYKDESKALNRVEQDGLIRGKNVDIWGDEPVIETAESKAGSAISEHTKASVAPKTLREQPIRIEENDLTKGHIDAGKSYNPSLESWKALIDKEYNSEYKLELNRQKIQEHQDKIQHLIATLADEELLESDEEEEGKETAEVEATAEEHFDLSINKPTEIKIKTKTKRNREAKHKKRLELEQTIKDFKKQIRDLQNLDEILVKEKAAAAAEIANKTKTKAPRDKKKKLFKYESVETPLEVKLSDELTNNLKNLKPEGNLFYDQMLNLQSSGKIEARVPVAKRRRYQPKMTEKWSYKNFK